MKSGEWIEQEPRLKLCHMGVASTIANIDGVDRTLFGLAIDAVDPDGKRSTEVYAFFPSESSIVTRLLLLTMGDVAAVADSHQEAKRAG